LSPDSEIFQNQDSGKGSSGVVPGSDSSFDHLEKKDSSDDRRSQDASWQCPPDQPRGFKMPDFRALVQYYSNTNKKCEKFMEGY
jgi:hypothetical protein